MTAIWRRPALTRAVMEYYARAMERVKTVELVGAVAGSEGDASRSIAEGAGWHYVEAENSPLGAKFNAALAAARELEPDAVVVIGSDDLLSDRVWTAYNACLGRGYPYAGLSDCMFYDLESRRFVHWLGYTCRRPDPIGLGRMIAKPLLEAVDWRLWKDDVVRGLDSCMTSILRPYVQGSTVAMVSCAKSGIGAMDVKTDENVWTYDDMLTTGVVEEGDAEKAIKALFADGTYELLEGVAREVFTEV